MIRLDFNGFVSVMAVLGLVIGVIGAFVIFFWFMSGKNENHFTGRLKKAYDFLHFRFYIIEGILKFCYVLMACICTTVGIFLTVSIIAIGPGVILLVGGNLAVRIVYEFLLMLVLACRHLGDISRQMKTFPDQEFPAVRAEEKPEPDRQVSMEAAAAVVMESQAKACYCPHCGTKCSTDYTYCNMCGTKLQN